MAKPSPEITRMVAAQRRDMLDLLTSLDHDQWEQPSWCDGWTVHHLVAHITLPYTSRQSRMMKEMIRARGSFDRAADRMAREDAETYDRDALLRVIADNVDHPWNPPGGGATGALSHDVIHSYDVTGPLGLPPCTTAERVTTCLASARPFQFKGFGVDIKATRFQATDADFAIGPDEIDAARTVAAPVLDLMPYATGRRPLP